MENLNLQSRTHSHRFDIASPLGKKKTSLVLILTFLTMVIELVGGLFFHSMALFADGCHMLTHVAAMGISVFAYCYAEKHAADPRFSFGPGKVSALAGFTSAMLLVIVGLYMIVESAERLWHPLPISFQEAIFVASFGLGVNVLSAFLLKEDHSHHHHGHSHDEAEKNHTHVHDLNLRSAYLHVIADAAVSILAIAALTLGKFFGWNWLDAMTGIVGSFVIFQWSFSLIYQTSAVLLDREMDLQMAHEICTMIEKEGEAKVTDLHLLRVGLNQFALVLSVMTEKPQSPDFYKKLLQRHKELAHISIEINLFSEALA